MLDSAFNFDVSNNLFQNYPQTFFCPQLKSISSNSPMLDSAFNFDVSNNLFNFKTILKHFQIFALAICNKWLILLNYLINQHSGIEVLLYFLKDNFFLPIT